MTNINPTKILFIKLGARGIWEEECIEKNNTLRLAFDEASHQDAIQGNWDAVRESLKVYGDKEGPLTDRARQVREFYESDENTLWLTFYKKKLWWCFAESPTTIQQLDDRTKVRPVKDKWSDTDTKGTALTIDHLSGKLLTVQGYRGTICEIRDEVAEYVVAKLNGKKLPEVEKAIKTRDQFTKEIGLLIQHLHWKDFETLVDLIFTQSGWQRLGVLGEVEKMIDLDLVSPVTNERIMVQIKSDSNRAEFERYKQQFDGMSQYQKMFYVVHTPRTDIKKNELETDNINLFLLEDVARLTVRTGLADWVIKKTS